MTDDEFPVWEPPFAGDETGALLGMLERLRATFRWKCADLDADGLDTRLGPSSLTLGGLLKHLAVQEEYSSTTKLAGEPVGPPWESAGAGEDDHDDGDWEFTSAADDTPEQLYAWWDEAVARSRARYLAALDDGGPGRLVHAATSDGTHANLRRLLGDLVEEYGRHTGQADLIREAVDGRVGEDPPWDWTPPHGAPPALPTRSAGPS